MRPLDRLALGDDVAASLGGRPRRVRLAAAVAAALLASSAAALAGLLGFLGLVIPHLVRLAGGTVEPPLRDSGLRARAAPRCWSPPTRSRGSSWRRSSCRSGR